MRDTKKVSVWPVGLVGKLWYERPVVEDGRVVSWYTYWGHERPFPMDMAGFAINVNLLLSHPEAEFSETAKRGYLESSLLNGIITVSELEPKAEDCTKVLGTYM